MLKRAIRLAHLAANGGLSSTSGRTSRKLISPNSVYGPVDDFSGSRLQSVRARFVSVRYAKMRICLNAGRHFDDSLWPFC